MQTTGIFFDGETAVESPVTVSMAPEAIIFAGVDVSRHVWGFAELIAVDPPHRGQPLRLTVASRRAARLVLRDEAFIAALIGEAPALRGGFNPRRMAKPAAWIAGSLAALALAVYLVMQFAPQKLASALPESWRQRLGAQIEASLTDGARTCLTPGGQSAIAAMAARLAEANPDLPPVTIQVYDIPIMNAFAMPGGRIVITRELIEQAGTPEEVAGVLAHELGHVIHRHPEAQIIRAMGLQVVIGIATGGGDTLSSFAGLAAILRYSRGAEAEADEFALKTMAAARVDPLGLKRFFELVLKQEGEASTGAIGKIASAFSTHPGTEERIKSIQPLPPGQPPREIMDSAKWQALKNICQRS